MMNQHSILLTYHKTEGEANEGCGTKHSWWHTHLSLMCSLRPHLPPPHHTTASQLTAARPPPRRSPQPPLPCYQWTYHTLDFTRRRIGTTWVLQHHSVRPSFVTLILTHKTYYSRDKTRRRIHKMHSQTTSISQHHWVFSFFTLFFTFEYQVLVYVIRTTHKDILHGVFRLHY